MRLTQETNLQGNSNAWCICISKLNSKQSVTYQSEIVPDNIDITCYPGFDMDYQQKKSYYEEGR